MTLTSLSRSKGQGLQAALLTAVLACRGCSGGRGKLLLCCCLLGGSRHLGTHGGGEGWGHIMAAACLQLVAVVVLGN